MELIFLVIEFVDFIQNVLNYETLIVRFLAFLHLVEKLINLHFNYDIFVYTVPTFLPGYDCPCEEHRKDGKSCLGNNSRREEQLATVDDVFVWAVLNIKTDVAMALLPRTEYPMGCMLYAICILNVLKTEIGVLNELYDNVEVAIEIFEKLSVTFINR